ncbi:MAG: ABC transporter substrate-binding protein [Acetobacteraceae bacterium]|nr:ABC transporter substrate-binding protein [Acetobacteraceae bacterium]MBV8523560.1 ABC transporter substrate-binding protein [Acetobacteraceae bacterium]
MKQKNTTRGAGSAAALALGIGVLGAASGYAAEPIKIGVISEEGAVAGASISRAAQLAADDINANGGVNGRKIEIITYDDHSSAADAVRAFQRAVNQDHVNAIVVSYISEVVLAVEPWAARLHMPTITPGAASNDISRQVHDDYAHYKYMFHGWETSAFIAQGICDAAHDILVNGLHMQSSVIMSEDAAWTKPLDAQYAECLPKAGLKVLDHIRFNPDTTDFTPIFNDIESKHPDVIITGISHVGVQPTVQWHDQQVPIPMAGQSSQATTSTFWKSTNGAAEGVITATAAVPDVALTPSTIPFSEAYIKRFGDTPSYTGYSTYDDIHIIADAIKRAGSTEPDKMVEGLEKTDYVGTLGRVQFYGKDDQFTHALKYGKDYIQQINIQWQSGKQVCVWPSDKCNGKLRFPPFIHLPQQAANK